MKIIFWFKVEDLQARLENLKKNITMQVYEIVCKGLFE